MADISKITVPIEQADGSIENVTFDIKDSTARQLITDLGNSVYWIGVTTTALTDGGTENPVSVGGEAKTAKVGGMAQYDGEEFIWNGTAWQSVGKNNFKALAFKDEASGSYTPVGTVSQPTTTVNTTETTVNSITDVGTLPTYTVSSETLVISSGTLPTKGADTTVVASVDGAETTQPTFTGTQGEITVS